MPLYIGADHRGYRLKEALLRALKGEGYEVVDAGNADLDPNDDYVDFARAVAEHVSRDPEQGRGILVCGSGVGMAVAANKFKRVRAAQGFSNDQVFAARHDDDANVLVFASDFTNESEALQMMKVFLDTPFGSDERYRRRVDKIMQIEGA